MDAHHSRSIPKSMQGRDVAKPYNPLCRSFQFGECQLVNQLDGSISATIADDGFDGWVGKCPTYVADALSYGSCIASIDYFSYIRSDNRLESPAA